MNTHRQALYQAVLTRISLGAVPVDGLYWFDPKAARTADGEMAKQRKHAAAPPPDTVQSPVSPSWPRALRRLQWFESAE